MSTFYMFSSRGHVFLSRGWFFLNKGRLLGNKEGLLEKHTDSQKETEEEDVAGSGAKNLVEGFAIKGLELAIGFEMEEKIDEVDDGERTEGEGGDEE